MNSRLKIIYNKIRSDNREDFLKNRVELDQHWGNNIWGITLQIDLDRKAQNILTKIQEEVGRQENENFLYIPGKAQHISFNQVIFWNGNYSLDKQQVWANIKEEFIGKFLEMSGVFESFQIEFRELIATKGGIILCAYDTNDQMQKLRESLLNELPFPKETTRFISIIHTTVARYQSKFHNPKEIYSYCSNFDQGFDMVMKKIKLKEELVFPSLKAKTIAQIDLI